MKAAEKARRRELVVRAQEILDREVGPRTVAHLMGKPMTPRLLRRAEQYALEALTVRMPAFDGWVEAQFAGKLLGLYAHGSRR